MDSSSTPQLPRVEESKLATKKAKAKKKPMKVVYISNPMKFKTSVSQFRALVQELTGQDAEFPDPTKFFNSDSYDGVPGNKTVPDAPPKSVDDDDDDDNGPRSPDPSPEQPERPDVPSSTYQSFEDDHFVPQMMLDIFSSFWPYDSSGHLDVLRSPYYDV